MVTEHDEGVGVVKTFWNEIRARVTEVEPTFAKLVDELAPNKKFPLFLVYLPYGALKGDTTSSYFPNEKGQYCRLSDPNIHAEILRYLGYGKAGSPMGMVLEKQLEYFIDLKEKKITIPWLVYSPGEFFPFSTILGCRSDRIYSPNGLLTVTSGVRSAFMLPNIGCNIHHVYLQRDFGIKRQAPKTLYDHWFIFKEIVNHQSQSKKWKSCLLYFSESWVNKLHTDNAWAKLKLYLYETAWRKFEYERNRIYYDIAFSLLQEKRNLKPNPYLTDTARHLFAISLGVAPGYEPACTEESLPLNQIQNVLINSYGLIKYIPTIMQPAHYNFEKSCYPVYYSLQHPSTHMFSPKSRGTSSTLSDMRELEHIMSIFCEELASTAGVCSDTILGTIAQNVKFSFYHNKKDLHNIVLSSNDVCSFDSRFQAMRPNTTAKFSRDAPFLRGCVSIKSI